MRFSGAIIFCVPVKFHSTHKSWLIAQAGAVRVCGVVQFITVDLSKDDEAGIFHLSEKIRQMRPIVRVGRGIDVTRSGVWRAVMNYALVRVEEVAAADGDVSASHLLAAGVAAPSGSRGATVSKLKVLLPDELLAKIRGRGRQLTGVSTVRDATAILLIFGLQQLRKEDSAEVAEFLKQHFDSEAVSGLRRGRRVVRAA